MSNKSGFNLSGKRFGNLTVCDEFISCNGKKWKCVCDCGNICYMLSSTLTTKNYKSCGCRAKNDRNPRVSNLIISAFWRRIASRSIRRNFEFSITPQYLEDVFISQNSKCALSGIKLILPTKAAEMKTCNASVDRIDSNLGYIRGNIQFVHKDINLMKNVLSMDVFINYCKAVANN